MRQTLPLYKRRGVSTPDYPLFVGDKNHLCIKITTRLDVGDKGHLCLKVTTK